MRENLLHEKILKLIGDPSAPVVVGPGDDLAVLRLGDRTLMIGTDQVIDGVHVRLDEVGPSLAARKAVMRAFSDVAAMAGAPIGCLMTATLRRTTTQADAEEMVEAAATAARECGAELIGGDTAMGNGPLVLGVTVVAEAAGIEPVLRSGAKPGDAIFVTGTLGGAWSGGADARHLHFTPRIEEARHLAGRLTLHAMMDLSDGLSMDLPRICRASDVDAELDARHIPISPGSDLEAALHDGEDYELCFTVGADQLDRVPDSIGTTSVRKIGRIVESAGPPGCWLVDAAQRRRLEAGGWEHRA
ncbi:MAG: thiamine-phosphate kinase [Phycisphaeraceae bacterium]|nr:thiamine-phosphate kinase [Phycisphaeraceae bacterium]